MWIVGYSGDSCVFPINITSDPEPLAVYSKVKQKRSEK